MQINSYFDLHKQTVDFNPIVVNRFGTIGVTLRFLCEFGNRKIISSIWAYPNGAEPKRLDNLTRAFTYLRKTGSEQELPERGVYGQIRPMRGINKAVYLKHYWDTRNPVHDRTPRFVYENAITTPHGSIDIVGRYDGKQLIYDFKSKPRDLSFPIRFKHNELEQAILWLEYRMVPDGRKLEKWSDEDLMPKSALMRTRKRGIYV